MVRASLLVFVVLVLAACGDRSGDPMGGGELPSSISPRFAPPEGWTWGLIGSTPQQRYGVSSPDRVPLAIVVIIPGYGEPAEVWFETAADLITAGHTVWILDRAGQSGSGRYVAPADLGFIPSFDVETAALRTFLLSVVKPRSDDVVILLTHADGAAVGLEAVRNRLPIDGLVASSAELAQQPARPLLSAIQRLDVPPPGWRPWSQDGPDDRALGRTHDELRGRLRQAWMTSRPDLRLSGPSLGWTRAFETVSRTLVSAPHRLDRPILMINANHAASELCKAAPACSETEISGAHSAMHLEADKWRKPWLSAVSAFVSDRTAQRRTVAFSRTSAAP